MEQGQWVRSRKNDSPGYRIYLKEGLFGKVRFWLWIAIDIWGNAHVSLSSGVKRKHKFTFEEKGVKNPGLGLRPLFWVRDSVLEFPEYFRGQYGVLRSISVGASDARRYRIYAYALKPYGFRETPTKEYGKILFLKLGNKKNKK